jgi:hypothetical protein
MDVRIRRDAGNSKNAINSRKANNSKYRKVLEHVFLFFSNLYYATKSNFFLQFEKVWWHEAILINFSSLYTVPL